MRRLPGSTLVELIISTMLAGFVLTAIQFTLGVAMNQADRSEQEEEGYDAQYLEVLKLKEVLFNHELKESGDSVLLFRGEQVRGWYFRTMAIIILKTGLGENDTIGMMSGQPLSPDIADPLSKYLICTRKTSNVEL